jgi:hypothetical protein
MITAEEFLGVPGMILFIPFASIAKLIADRSPRLKILSILLGEGDINKNTALNFQGFFIYDSGS